MRINFILPSMSRKKFSGGLFGLMKYADGLAKRGHQVNVIPMLPSAEPAWFNGEYRFVSRALPARTWSFLHAWGRMLGQSLNLAGGKGDMMRLKSAVWDMAGKLLLLVDHRAFPLELRRAASLLYLRHIIPEAEVTIASSFETALPTALYGSGKKFYFVQHFEPYFRGECSNPELAEKDAHLSYGLGLTMIANSTWLKRKLEAEVAGVGVALCPNAIDHDTFCINGKPHRQRDGREVVVISYGGRDAVWKGFHEMVQAVGIVRKALPAYNIRWQVYGSALVAPDNNVASYESLGFLNHADLANAYRDADILLSASWYESFPAFPLEAMACGLPVITTQHGAEDYAIHGETAEIVEAGNPDGIAQGLIHLIKDDEHRQNIARKGYAMSKKFTWASSVNRMEEIISG